MRVENDNSSISTECFISFEDYLRRCLRLLMILFQSKSANLMKSTSFSYFEFTSAVFDAISHIQLLILSCPSVFQKN